MKNHRLFIRILIAVSWILLTGFKSSPHHRLPATSTQVNAGAGDNKAAAEQEAKPPLDLTVPFNNADGNKPASIESRHNQQDVFDGLFTAQPKKPSPPFQLKGGLINSPEPEVEKRKSVDGAGIMIDIKQ